MYYNDHAPARFHAPYAEHHAQVEIERLALVGGSLPPLERIPGLE
jgi:hypothetical protein